MSRIIICKECGEEKEHSGLGLCNNCYIKKWKEENPEKIKDIKKRYYYKNKDEAYESSKKWRSKNIQKIQGYHKKYRESKKGKNMRDIYTQKNTKQLNEYNKNWKINNPEKVKEQRKRYRKLNKDKIKEYRTLYYIKNKKLILSNIKKYKQRNKEKIRQHRQRQDIHQRKIEYERNRRRIAKNRLSNNISRLISFSLKHNKEGYHWEYLVGYTLNDLQQHLEKQFKDGINWKNYGKHWHIDHRIPVSWFKFNSYEDGDFKKCWALDNLQPKITKENLSKNNRYAEPTLNQVMEIES